MVDRPKCIPEEEEKGLGDTVDICVVGMGSVKYPLSGHYKEREEGKKRDNRSLVVC